MDFQDAIRSSLSVADYMVYGYLADIAVEEMLERPVPGANHIAWQLGHLISAERHLAEAAAPGSMPDLPAGFAERYGRSKKMSDDPDDFLTKEEYMRLAKEIRSATLAALEKLSPADFDQPITARVPPFVKTVGDAFVTIGNHWTLHAGQWVVLRRKLGRQVMF